MRRNTPLIVCFLLFVFALGCGGDRAYMAAPDTLAAQYTTEAASDSLPALPTGELDVRRSQVVDGDTQPGSAAIDSLNGTAGGSEMLLLLPSGETLAYAVYQLPARPDPPDYFTFNTTSYDGEPLVAEPLEGYWVAYADYAQDSWALAGPFTTSQTRVPVPETADVISPGDNLYCAVIMLSGNVTMIHSVSASYYTDLGYETKWLEAPQGLLVNRRVDIQVDEEGNPQIAYLRNGSVIDGGGGQLRIARREAGHWTVSEVPTLYDIWDVVFRLGSNGRRALLASGAGGELHLLYDDGGGSFGGDYLVSTGNDSDNMPGMSFFNAAGDPDGERNDLMIVYEAQDVWPDFFVRSYLYDGVNPPTLDDVFLDSKERIGRLSLTTNADNTLLLGELSQPAPGSWLVNTMTYNEFGFWVGLPNEDWVDLPIEDDYSLNPGIATCELPGGNLAAAYRHEGGHGVVLGLLEDDAWQSQLTDTVGCRAYPVIDLEPYSDGSVGFLSTYADERLQLFRATPANGESAAATAIDNNMTDLRCGSMAVDDTDTTHIATCSREGDGLLYYTVDGDGVSAREVIDTGGWSRGAAFGLPAMVNIDDDLHIFYADSAHSRLLYSLNRAGVWLAENEIIPTDSPCGITWQAGYLEDTNLLYIVYQDVFDTSMHVLTFTPGGTDYQTNLLLTNAERPPGIADDETNVGCVYGYTTLMYGTRLFFRTGPPRLAPHPEVLVSDASDSVEGLNFLSYNSVDETWLASCQGDDVNTCLIHTRDPAGLWSGPRLVSIQPGASIAAIWGIEYDRFTGINYVITNERPDGSTILDVNVYADSTADRHFDYVDTVMSFDQTAYAVGGLSTAPGVTGWPFICLQVKPLGDPDWNYKVMAPESSFSWVSDFIWQSTCVDPLVWPEMVVMDSNMPAIALIEGYRDSDEYGRAVVRYPW